MAEQQLAFQRNRQKNMSGKAAARAQAALCRRHQPRRPQLAVIRPDNPAPAIGPCTASEGAEETEKLSTWEIPPLAKAENPAYAESRFAIGSFCNNLSKR
jgi:hypothetical protein